MHTSINIRIILVATFLSHFTFGQITGKVLDESGHPMPYVNVWIKNSFIGATTGGNGNFTIDRAKSGDTLVVSNLGYEKVELVAKKENEISLQQKIEELDEVVIIPMKQRTEHFVNSFRKIKKNRHWYNNGFYSLARFYEHKKEYANTPFVKQISFVTNNAKNENEY